VTPFLGLLGFNTLALLLAAAGVGRGHAVIQLRRRPRPRKPPETAITKGTP
jgi:hypothetical protein